MPPFIRFFCDFSVQSLVESLEGGGGGFHNVDLLANPGKRALGVRPQGTSQPMILREHAKATKGFQQYGGV